MDSLSVIYKGQDIGRDQYNLIAERIKIVNKGGDIRPIDFGLDTFGLKITNCRIIDVDIPKIGDAYLSNTIRPTIVDTNKILLNKTVFEKDKEVFLDIYLLYRNNANPDYTPIGKITGQELIDIFQADEDNDYDWSDLGYILFIALMIVAYGICWPWLIYKIIKGICQWNRRRIISSLLGHPLKKLNDEEIVIVKIYGILGQKEFLNTSKNLLDYSVFIDSIWDLNLAMGKVNEWMQNEKKFLRRYRWLTMGTSYEKIHDILKSADLIIRNESKKPIALKDSFINELKKTLVLLGSDFAESNS